jgi:hypothetical protein
MGLNRFKTALLVLSFLSITISSCSTTHVVETKKPLPVIPEYVRVPHPAGFDLADLRAILVSPLAPADVNGAFAETCDAEFKKLAAATPQKEERYKGALELVTQDPERMHWCYYTKISKLQEILQGDSTWSERQKLVLESFEFLSPVANAFLKAYHDSRYLRWAAQYYSKISEWVFFKKLAPTPESTAIFTNGSRPELEPWVSVQREDTKPNSVFAKYGISFQPTVAGATNPFDQEARVPASVATPTAPALAQPPTVAHPEPQSVEPSVLNP